MPDLISTLLSPAPAPDSFTWTGETSTDGRWQRQSLFHATRT
jgi:hypothetical protein